MMDVVQRFFASEILAPTETNNHSKNLWKPTKYLWKAPPGGPGILRSTPKSNQTLLFDERGPRA